MDKPILYPPTIIGHITKDITDLLRIKKTPLTGVVVEAN